MCNYDIMNVTEPIKITSESDMRFDDKILKAYLKNAYFINGTAYAGKSTACRILSKRYDLVLVGENHRFDDDLELTTRQDHPHMNDFKTMNGFEEFVTRTKEDYDAWIHGVSKETTPFEILELISLSRDRKVIVDTNIPHEILVRIAEPDHIAYMVATPKIAMEHFFDRHDSEKRFLLDVIEQSEDPSGNLERYKETIAYINRQEIIDHFKNSGIFTIERTSVDEDIEPKIRKLVEHFKLKRP